MPVQYIELENFKSYAGRQRIGPFFSFTSVIGPNGSGKSNLLDAVSFVFGVQSRDLRSTQMKDLIFRPPGTTKASRLSASATLVYRDPNTEEITRFTRTISHDGKGDYKVNGKTVSYGNYEKILANFGVLLKARNFLVFQGDVENIARKSPKQLVDMIEQISGSGELAQEYDESLQKKEEAEAAAVFAYQKLKGYKNERKVLKEQKEEAARYDEKLVEKAKLLTEFYLWQIFHLREDVTEREVELQQWREELAELLATSEEARKKLTTAKKKSSETRRAVAAAEKTRLKVRCM
jgi:structural maintenance of chromosome 1